MKYKCPFSCPKRTDICTTQQSKPLPCSGEVLCIWQPQDFTFLWRMAELSCERLRAVAQYFHRVKYVVCKELVMSQRKMTAITCKGAQAEKKKKLEVKA